MNTFASTCDESHSEPFANLTEGHLDRDALREAARFCQHLLENLRMEAESARSGVAVAVGELVGQGVLFARKNRFGFTKSEAKKLFYSLRGGQPDDDDDDPGEKPDPAEAVVSAKGPDEKIERIIDYMRETSTKLDRIEDDIQFLKTQVDRILEKI